MARRGVRIAQAWIEPQADDPQASSAAAVARARLSAAKRLTGLRCVRVMELLGPLPDRDIQEELLHRSTQFYNPHKERLTLRLAPADRAPIGAGEHVVLVTERGAERRPAAERWWLHETERAIEVREGVAWVLAFAAGENASGALRDLAVLADRHHGLLCNPFSQEARFAGVEIPLPWLSESTGRRIKGGKR